MESVPPLSKSKEEKEEEDERVYKKYTELISTLPLETGWVSTRLRKYQGYWFFEQTLHATMVFRQHFRSRHGDILLATNPRSGTTWMKALMFATVNRTTNPPDAQNHPLLSLNPHECIPFTDLLYFQNQIPDLDVLSSPRLLSTHTPYSLLPESIRDSDCRIIYVCRNLKDNFVSQWQFFEKMRTESMMPLPLTLEKAFELFSEGISMFGPAWDNALEYWKESLRRPDRVLFLHYEGLKENPVGNLKRVAEFMGCPFTREEEGRGIVECILKLCSFEHLRNLEVNKTGVFGTNHVAVNNSIFFRKAEVGEWTSHLTPEMVERLDEIVEQKLGGSSGLSFSSMKEN